MAFFVTVLSVLLIVAAMFSFLIGCFVPPGSDLPEKCLVYAGWHPEFCFVSWSGSS